MQVDHGLFDCQVQVVLPWQPLSYYWWCVDQSDLLLEVAVKWVLNAVSTGVHVLRGKVLNNKMVDLRVRCVGWTEDSVTTWYKNIVNSLQQQQALPTCHRYHTGRLSEPASMDTPTYTYTPTIRISVE